MPPRPDDHIDADDQVARLAAEQAGLRLAGLHFRGVKPGAEGIAVAGLGACAGTVAGAGAAGRKIIVMGFQRGVPPSHFLLRLRNRDLDQGKTSPVRPRRDAAGGDFGRDVGVVLSHDKIPKSLNFDGLELAAGLSASNQTLNPPFWRAEFDEAAETAGTIFCGEPDIKPVIAAFANYSPEAVRETAKRCG